MHTYTVNDLVEVFVHGQTKEVFRVTKVARKYVYITSTVNIENKRMFWKNTPPTDLNVISVWKQ
jgi:hypothetical protein